MWIGWSSERFTWVVGYVLISLSRLVAVHAWQWHNLPLLYFIRIYFWLFFVSMCSTCVHIVSVVASVLKFSWKASSGVAIRGKTLRIEQFRGDLRGSDQRLGAAASASISAILVFISGDGTCFCLHLQCDGLYHLSNSVPVTSRAASAEWLCSVLSSSRSSQPLVE